MNRVNNVPLDLAKDPMAKHVSALPATSGVIDNVTGRLRNRSRVQIHLDIARANREAVRSMDSGAQPKAALVELHCTDACDLDCTFCTYSDRNTESFPWKGIARIAALEPRAVVLAGGGEPTLYRDGQLRISELIIELRRLLPQTHIGLISNGALVPNAAAMAELSWVRVSMDASTEKAYNIIKRTSSPSYEKRLDNIANYMRSSIPDVGVGFVYNRSNLHQAADFVMEFFTITEGGRRQNGEFSLQFRPTCGIESCACPSPNYAPDTGRLMTPDKAPWWIEAREHQLKRVREMMAVNPQFERFVNTFTNLLSGEFQRPIEQLGDFPSCYLALVRLVIRADGDMFPCVMTASQRKRKIGNILTSSGGEMLQNMNSYYALREGFCRGRRDCCNIDGVKNIYLEQADRCTDNTVLAPVGGDPFF